MFVFPSITDTVGLALLEALASGLPVVASHTAAAEELLAGAPAAELVPAEDGARLLGAATRLPDGAPPGQILARTAGSIDRLEAHSAGGVDRDIMEAQLGGVCRDSHPEQDDPSPEPTRS